MRAKTLSCLFILLFLQLRPVFAQSTVNFTAGPSERNVTLADMTPVPDGNEVRLGFFTVGFDVSLNAYNLPALAAEWHQYGMTNTRSIFGQPGRFGATVMSSDAAFDGKKPWLWVLETTNNAAPLPDFSNVSHYGIFSSDAAAWVFPAHDAIPPSDTTSLSSSDVVEAFHGSFDPNHLMLTAVPEPSPISFLALGIVGFALTARWVNRREHFSPR